MSIYASPGAREGLAAWYPRFRAKIAAPTAERTVPTRFGDTHVLVGGPEGAPPVLLFHGAMATSAHVMVEVQPLLSRFRVYAPDVLGHSPMSADARPALDRYGDWATDVLDGLGLDRVALIAVSYGGFVGLRLLAAAPARVSRASLIVPAGIVSGSIWDGMVRVGVPMAMYRWFPSEARLRAFVEPQFTRWDDDWGHWLGEAVRGFKLDFRVPPLAKPEDLRGFTAPVQVFAASDDVHFPGPALLERARLVLPNVVDAELLECKHAPPFEAAFRERLSARIAGFFDGQRAAA
jgi:2-hydroxy-6-oxonona-2,4-dienedioate hydrolase